MTQARKRASAYDCSIESIWANATTRPDRQIDQIVEPGPADLAAGHSGHSVDASNSYRSTGSGSSLSSWIL